MKFLSKSRKETVDFGQRLARCLKPGDIVCLFGDLGSGKTTLTKGIAKGLKIDDKKVNSPSFVFLNIYKGRLPLFHFDLYRIEKSQEIYSLGLEDYLYDDGVSVIEWAERLGALLPKEYLGIQLKFKSESERSLEFKARGPRAKEILKKLRL